MSSKLLYPLTNNQKWRLGFGLAIIYVPIRIYINVIKVDEHIFWFKLPLWVIELMTSVIFYTLWINVVEWLQRVVSTFLGEDFLDEFKFLNQLLTLLIAIGLAVMFNTGFRTMWHYMEAMWEQHKFFISPITINELPEHRKRANTGITIMALMAAYYLAANKRVYQRLQEVHFNAERMEKENIKAQFNALKNQVSPHFLFNNFSVLTSLVETNQALSIEFISRLSKAYRYILEKSDLDYILLRTEIEFLDTYMFLLKTRFENKLNLEIKVSEYEKDSYSIVPLTLQLLVENAVKHNRMSASNPLIITIEVTDGFLTVSNPLQLRELSESSTRLGLHNIINRYKLLINKTVLVSQEENRFVVKIPLIS